MGAITNTKQMKGWYFDIAEFKPEVGYKFEFTAGSPAKSYRHLCKVIEVVPSKKLAYSWRYDGYKGSSVVTFELFEDGKSTILKLTHRGLESFSHDLPDFAKENFANCWKHIVGISLKGYVEK